MTKKEIKEAALRWIDEATVGGRKADTDELADYKDRMNVLLNGAIRQVAVYFPLYAVWETEAKEELIFPEDFCELEQVLYKTPDGRWENCSSFKRVGANGVIFPSGEHHPVRFYYVRYPATIAPDAEEDSELDLANGAEDLAALRLASDITAGVEEKSSLSALLDRRFHTAASSRMSLQNRPKTEIETRYGGLV